VSQNTSGLRASQSHPLLMVVPDPAPDDLDAAEALRCAYARLALEYERVMATPGLDAAGLAALRRQQCLIQRLAGLPSLAPARAAQ
jgi:hypothetical protein